MSDTIRYLCCSCVYLEGCTKPCFFKHRRSQNNSKKFTIFSTSFCHNLHPKLMPIFCQNHQTLFKLSSAFFELCYSLNTFSFFFPTATSMFTTPLKQHSTKTRLCRADKSLKNTRAAFCRELERGRWDMLNASYSCVKWKMPLDCLSHKGLTQL